MLDILEWEWACQIERHIETRVIKEQSWWKTKHYWQGFVFPWSPLCPHWCPCLVSSRLSYPTGFTKLKRDWLFFSNFLCRPRPADRSCRFQERWSYVYITVNHYTPLLLRHWWVGPTCAINTPGANLQVVSMYVVLHCYTHGSRRAIHLLLIFSCSVHKRNNCYTFMHILILYFLSNTHGYTKMCTYKP